MRRNTQKKEENISVKFLPLSLNAARHVSGQRSSLRMVLCRTDTIHTLPEIPFWPGAEPLHGHSPHLRGCSAAADKHKSSASTPISRTAYSSGCELAYGMKISNCLLTLKKSPFCAKEPSQPKRYQQNKRLKKWGSLGTYCAK